VIEPFRLSELTTPPVPLGREEVRLGVGPICVAYRGLSAALAEAMRERYGSFLSETPAHHAVDVGRGDEAYLEPAADGYLRLEEIPAGQGRALLSTDLAAWRSDAHGTLRLSSPDAIAPSLRGLENYLRWTSADLALDWEGFVFHSAGVVKGGRAYLFFGPSGAGKSTVSGLSRPLPLLSDDLVLVLKTGGTWKAAATPFAGSLPQEDKTPGAFPLAGLFRLVQAREHRLASLGPAALAVASMLSCCPFAGGRSRREALLLPLLEDLRGAHPPFELYFRKDGGFWTLLP
jgi:hypothetical protein